jgi:hypothetical protein
MQVEVDITVVVGAIGDDLVDQGPIIHPVGAPIPASKPIILV